MISSLIALENAMDAENWDDPAISAIPELRALILAAKSDDWQTIYSEAARIIDDESANGSSLEIKAFALQWAVIATEVQFDLTLRKRWVARWDALAWAENEFSTYLRAYQLGLTAFFDGALREAEARFTLAHELARGFDYQRGELRNLFHLGLVQRDLGHVEAALEFFASAERIAKLRRDFSYQKRIQDQIEGLSAELGASLSGEFSFSRARTGIERLIAAKDFTSARELLIHADIRRRRFKQGRKRESLYIYLPLIQAGLRPESSAMAWNRACRIEDPVLKIRIWELFGSAFGLTPAQEKQITSLKALHGVSAVITRSLLSSAAVLICGIPIEEVRDADVKALLTLLLQADAPVDKATLCERLWGFSYDPVTHDGRIYKLIHRARGFFKKPDLLINTYGAYQINPRFNSKKRAGNSKAS